MTEAAAAPKAVGWQRSAGMATALRLAVGGLLGLLAIGQLVESGRAIIYPAEINYGEAILYDHAARLLRGEPLYQPLDREPYTVAAYTPVYYWLAAAAHAVVGGGFAPGRAISVCAGLAVACSVALLARRLTGRWPAGLFAGALFLALGMPWAPGQFAPWSAQYKEDVLGVALAIGAIAVLATGHHRRQVVAAGALAALAILTKQTLVAPVLAGTIWLWPHGRGKAVLFAGTSAAIVGAVAATMELTTGAFFANAVFANANPPRLEAVVRNTRAFVLYQAGPLAAALLWIRWGFSRSSRGIERLLVLYWLASLLPLAGIAKAGADHNYWIEFAAVTAVLATAGVWRTGATQRSRDTALSAMVPLPLIALFISPMPLLNAVPLLTGRAVPITGTSPLTVSAETQRSFAALVERVRTEPGAVLAAPLDVVVLAGRPILLEPYVFSILETGGHWDSRPLVRQICRGDVRLLVVGQPLESADLVLHAYAHWPESIRAALRQIMVFEGRHASRYIYVPGQPSNDGVCGALSD